RPQPGRGRPRHRRRTRTAPRTKSITSPRRGNRNRRNRRRIRISRSDMAPSLQMSRSMRYLVIVACLAHVARANPFEPPSPVAEAQSHYVHGKSLFAAKQYAQAATEFAAAYDLDPSATFLLFNLGLAQRMADHCDDAV